MDIGEFLTPSALTVFAVGIAMLLPWWLYLKQPVMNAVIRRRLLGQTYWGVARIVGRGRNTTEIKIDLREPNFTVGNKNFDVQAAENPGAGNTTTNTPEGYSVAVADMVDAYYYESGVPILDYDFKDTRPIPHRITGQIVSSEHMESLKIGELAWLRAWFLSKLMAMLENPFLPLLLGILSVVIVAGAALSLFGAMDASKCVQNTNAILGYVNETTRSAASAYAQIPMR